MRIKGTGRLSFTRRPRSRRKRGEGARERCARPSRAAIETTASETAAPVAPRSWEPLAVALRGSCDPQKFRFGRKIGELERPRRSSPIGKLVQSLEHDHSSGREWSIAGQGVPPIRSSTRSAKNIQRKRQLVASMVTAIEWLLVVPLIPVRGQCKEHHWLLFSILNATSNRPVPVIGSAQRPTRAAQSGILVDRTAP